MAEYVSCPTCKTRVPVKRQREEFVRASSAPPDPKRERRDVDIENWFLNPLNQVLDSERSNKKTRHGDSRGSSVSNARIHEIIVDRGDPISDEEKVKDCDDVIEISDSDVSEELPLPEISPSLNWELIKKFKILPTVTGEKSLGNLIERFQGRNSGIQVTNLYHITYNVRSIKDCRLRGGTREFLVRWEGWSSRSDTWEPEAEIENDATPDLWLTLSDFFLRRDNNEEAWKYFSRYVQGKFLSSQEIDYLALSKLIKEKPSVQNDCVIFPKPADFYTKKLARLQEEGTLLDHSTAQLRRYINFAVKRLDAITHYHKWFEMISRNEPGADIDIENLVDCERLPSEFKYIRDYIVSDGVKVESPKKFCRCTSKSCFEEDCCGRHRYSSTCTYGAYRYGRLTYECSQVPLYECNSKCRCGFACANRLIQRGCRQKLTIFKTISRGWGVRARTFIREGSFLGEYLGELMTSSQALSRHTVNFSYLFDLMPIKGQSAEYTIDSAKFGNFTRFFNHSCDPNLKVSYVYIENHNRDAPRVAFFAKKDINCGDELTFDYHMQTTEGSGHLSVQECLCGASKCKKALF